MLVDNLLPVIKISDYNKIASFYDRDTYTLNDDEFILLADYAQMIEYENKALSEGVTIDINGKKYHNKYDKCMEGLIDMSGNKSNTGVVIIPDSVDTNEYVYVRSYLMANYKGDKDKKEEEFVKYGDEIADNGGFYNTKIDIYTASTGLRAIMIFIGLYLGVIFLISSACILALKELSDSTDNKEKFGMLKKIGVDDKRLNRALFIKEGIFFMIPLFVAIIHSIFGIKCANIIMKSMSVTGNMESILSTALLIVLIYGGYFLVTYFMSKRIINEK